MSELTQLKCVACRRGAPTVTAEEITEFHPQVPDWVIVERDSINRLERVFKFKDFVEPLDFTNRVGEIAEAEEHHPAMLTESGRVTLTPSHHKLVVLHPPHLLIPH